MSKVMVVYGTKSGCTAGIAERIGETLAAKGVDAEVVRAEDASAPTGCEAVIVGSGVRAGTWHSAAREWVTANAEVLTSMPVALFTCGLTTANDPGKEPEVRALTDTLIAETGISPIARGVFAGWNVSSGFSFLERSVLKLMKAPQGDFRDMDAVAAWVESLLPDLGIDNEGGAPDAG